MAYQRDVYVKTALLGLALLLAGSLTYSVAVLIADPARLTIELVIWVPALVVAAVLWNWRRWGLLVGVPVGAVGSLVLFGELEPALVPPSSFFDFVPTLLALPGILLFFLACFAGTVQHFRGSVSTDAARISLAFRGWVALVALLAVASAVLTAFEADSVSAEDADGAVVVTATGIRWDVQTLDAVSGETLRVLVRNEDPLLHTFTVHDLGIDVIIGPWQEKVVVVEVSEARILGFICRIEDHKQDMSGTIVAQ